MGAYISCGNHLGNKKTGTKLLTCKRIIKKTDPDIAGFKELYDARIKESMRIEVEEILKFIGREEYTDVEHHLLICKREKKYKTL